MHDWSSSLLDVIICALFALILWAPLGRWILIRFGAQTVSRSLAMATSFGLGAWGFWILALGLTGFLYKCVLLLSAVAAFTLLRLYRYLLRSPETDHKEEVHSLVAIIPITVLSIAYLALGLASSLAPEIAFDSLNVHLPYARDAAAAHRAGFEPNNWSSVMPALPLMSYITAFVFRGLALAKLFNFLCYLLCGGVIYFFTRRWWGRAPALAASLLFWSCPVAVYESTTAMIDLPSALFSAIAVLSLLEWTACDENSHLWLSATSLGLAYGCKYHTAFWLAPVLFVIGWRSFLARRLGLPRTLGLAARYLGMVALLALPWMIRSWYYTGNPVFPAANGIFKSPYFPPAMQAAAMASFANEGVGLSPKALLQLPWTLNYHPGLFRGTPGWIFLIGILVSLLRRKPPLIRYALVIGAFYFCTWAVTAQDIRYLLPMVPLLAVVSAHALGTWLPRTDLGPSRRAGIGKAMAAFAGFAVILAGSAIALPPVYPRVIKAWTYWHAYQSPLAFLLGRESAQDFLRRDVPSIYAYDYANAHLGQGDRILLLNDASRYYSRIPTLYSFTVEGERLLLEESEQGVLRRLEESRITHVLLNYNGIAPIPGVAPRRGVYFFLDREFQAKHMDVLFSRNNVTLYRLR
jgi:hypothetical protein